MSTQLRSCMSVQWSKFGTDLPGFDSDFSFLKLSLVPPFLFMVAGAGCTHHFEFDGTTQGARSWAGWKHLHYGNRQALQVTALFPGWLTVKYSAHSFPSVSVCFSVKGVHDSTGSVLWWVGIV